MGTDCITKVFDEDDNVLVAMSCHHDGRLSGHGKDLVEFLDGMKLVNGIPAHYDKIANGMDCLAAQIVAHFKKGLETIIYVILIKNLIMNIIYSLEKRK